MFYGVVCLVFVVALPIHSWISSADCVGCSSRGATLVLGFEMLWVLGLWFQRRRFEDNGSVVVICLWVYRVVGGMLGCQRRRLPSVLGFPIGRWHWVIFLAALAEFGGSSLQCSVWDGLSVAILLKELCSDVVCFFAGWRKQCCGSGAKYISSGWTVAVPAVLVGALWVSPALFQYSSRLRLLRGWRLVYASWRRSRCCSGVREWRRVVVSLVVLTNFVVACECIQCRFGVVRVMLVLDLCMSSLYGSCCLWVDAVQGEVQLL